MGECAADKKAMGRLLKALVADLGTREHACDDTQDGLGDCGRGLEMVTSALDRLYDAFRALAARGWDQQALRAYARVSTS